MDIKDIELGQNYLIHYVDRNYPCRCPCHFPIDGHQILHIVPCCYDRSYSGPAKCVDRDSEMLLCVFQVSESRMIRLTPQSVIKRLKPEGDFYDTV